MALSSPFLTLIAVTILNMATAPAASAEIPSCPAAQILCECSAVFSIIELEDAANNEKAVMEFRDTAASLKLSSMSLDGTSMVELVIRKRIKYWTSLVDNIQSRIELAQVLADCSKFHDKDLRGIRLSITP